MDFGSVFRAYVFSVEEINIELGKVRVSDKYGAYYEFTATNRNVLPLVAEQPALYEAVAYCRHFAPAKINKNPETREYPAVGSQIVQTIYCELIARGVATPPKIVSVNNMVNNPASGKNIPIIYNITPTMFQSDQAYDPLDLNKYNERAAQTPGVSMSPQGGVTTGIGNSNINVSQKSGTTNSTESQTNATQETNVGGGMMTTSLNFLQHYMIGIANAVALPMPHMVNMVKMVAIGKFVKNVIGTRGKRVDVGNGTTKWENGTGMYGLGDELVDIAKGKGE
jgi:hypothetical protein